VVGAVSSPGEPYMPAFKHFNPNAGMVTLAWSFLSSPYAIAMFDEELGASSSLQARGP